MIAVSFDVEVECSECGRGLTASFSNGMMTVEPCGHCLREKYNEGLNEEREGRDAEVAELKEEIEELKGQLPDARNQWQQRNNHE